jgi:hypothetical protein
MTTVRDPNNAVSVALALNDSVTVPTGEIWQVKATGRVTHLGINGVEVTWTGDTRVSAETIFPEGTTIEALNVHKNGTLLNGWDVSGYNLPNVVSLVLSQGDTFTVPTGSVYQVTVFGDNVHIDPDYGYETGITRSASNGQSRDSIRELTLKEGTYTIDNVSNYSAYIGGWEIQ